MPKNTPIKHHVSVNSNWAVAAEAKNEQRDRLIDKGNWSFQPPKRSGYREIRPRLETPLEFQLRLRERLIIAEHEREAYWTKERLVAAAKAEVQTRLARGW
jgi:hypothetical protein